MVTIGKNQQPKKNTYEGISPSTITIGGIAAGSNLVGRDLTSLFQELLVVYLSPAFTGAPNVSPQNTTVEVGTILTGVRTFTWAITNLENIKPNTISIFDITGAAYLKSSLANDSSEIVAIKSFQLNSNTATQQWKLECTNTNGVLFSSAVRTLVANYYRYYGPNTESLSIDATVKTLSNKDFQTANNNTFQLNTGSLLKKFIVVLPPGRTIVNVNDLDSLNADIKSQYVLTGTINIIDAGGTPRAYNYYEMNVGSAYSSNHRHEIKTQ